MSVQHLPLMREEPSIAAWDAFVTSHPAGHLLQMSGWGGLKQSAGWDVQRLLVTDGEAPRAGAQLLIRRRYGLSAVYVPRGPLLSGEPTIDADLLAGLVYHARRQRAVFLRLEPNLLETHPQAGDFAAQLTQAGFVTLAPLQPRSTIQLDLTPPAEKLLSAMSKGHRADIKRATREQVQVRTGSRADLGAFYAIMQDTAKRAEFGIHSRDYYERALELFGPSDMVRLFLAERDGVALATAMVAAQPPTALYLYSGSLAEGLQYGAQHAIQWQALQWAKARGCSMYDFWGIPDALGQTVTAVDDAAIAALEATARKEPLYGVYRFKKGFGGNIVRFLPAYDKVFLRLPYRIWRRLAM